MSIGKRQRDLELLEVTGYPLEATEWKHRVRKTLRKYFVSEEQKLLLASLLLTI